MYECILIKSYVHYIMVAIIISTIYLGVLGYAYILSLFASQSSSNKIFFADNAVDLDLNRPSVMISIFSAATRGEFSSQENKKKVEERKKRVDYKELIDIVASLHESYGIISLLGYGVNISWLVFFTLITTVLMLVMTILLITQNSNIITEFKIAPSRIFQAIYYIEFFSIDILFGVSIYTWYFMLKYDRKTKGCLRVLNRILTFAVLGTCIVLKFYYYPLLVMTFMLLFCALVFTFGIIIGISCLLCLLVCVAGTKFSLENDDTVLSEMFTAFSSEEALTIFFIYEYIMLFTQLFFTMVLAGAMTGGLSSSSVCFDFSGVNYFTSVVSGISVAFGLTLGAFRKCVIVDPPSEKCKSNFNGKSLRCKECESVVQLPTRKVPVLVFVCPNYHVCICQEAVVVEENTVTCPIYVNRIDGESVIDPPNTFISTLIHQYSHFSFNAVSQQLLGLGLVRVRVGEG